MTKIKDQRIGLVCAVAFASTVLLANWLIAHVGFVHVAPGLVAPAGVFAAGLALALRDEVQERLGRTAVVVSIIVGAALSYLVSPNFAAASAVAFLFSELVDMAVYTPLRAKGWTAAVLSSNLAGSIVDSAIFLLIAFGSLQFIAGQVAGKMEMTLLAVVALSILRRREPVAAEVAA